MIEAANHSARGTRATAETRSAHQAPTPSLADPRPIARAKGVRMSCMFRGSTVLPSHQCADDPGRNGEHHARSDDGPSRNVDRPKFESVDGVPDQMADAAAEMQKKSEGGPEQHDPTDPGRDGCLHRSIGMRSPRRRNQPDDKHNRTATQNNSGDPVEDRKDRRKLRPIDLYVGRQWPRSRYRGTGHHSSLPSAQSASALDHHLLDFGDRLARIEALRTGPRAVQNSVAAIKPKRVFKVVEPLFLRLVATVGQPAPGLQEHRGAEKAIAIPPMARATRGTAEAKDAFVVAVDLASLPRRLEPFPFGFGGLGFEPRLDRRILREEMREIGDEILDDPQVRQRINCRWRGQIGNEPRAGEPVRAINVHRARAANPLAA